MIASISYILYLGLLKEGISKLISLIKSYRQTQATLTQIRNQPIISHQQFKKHISQSTSPKQKTLFLVKNSCIQSEKLRFNFKIYSNQVLYNRIAIPDYLQITLNSMNSLNSSDNNQFRRMLWKSQDEIVSHIPIITDLSLIQHQTQYQSIFDSDDPPGLFFTIFKFAAATVAAVFEFFTFPAQSRERTLIDGPRWGTLSISGGLVLNTPFVLCCSFGEGEVIPTIIGLSKRNIIEYLQQKKSQFLFKSIMVSSLLLIFLRQPLTHLYRYLQSKINSLWSGPVFNLYNPEVEEDQACIICYAQCKNIIFKQCKHMIVCHQCAFSIANPIVACPLCRENIEDSFKLMEARP